MGAQVTQGFVAGTTLDHYVRRKTVVVEIGEVACGNRPGEVGP